MSQERPGLLEDSGAIVALISLVVSATSVGLVLSGPAAWHQVTERPTMFLSLLALTLALELASVEVYGRGRFSFAGSGFLAIGFTFGVGAAMATALLSAAINFARFRGRPYRALFTAATWALAAAAGTLPYTLLGAGVWSEVPRFAPTIAAGPVYLLVNIGLLTVAMALSEAAQPRAIWRERFRWMIPYYVASGPLALAFVIGYERLGLTGLFALALPPAFMMISAQQYLKKTRAAVEEARARNIELQTANGELAKRNDDLRDLFGFAGGLATRAHDRAELVAFAETFLSSVTGGTARIRIGPGSGGTTLTVGGNQVGTLSLVPGDEFDEPRWARIRDAILPQLATAIEGADLVERVRKMHLDTIAALSRSMEAKDCYTGGHTERVARIAVAVARRLGYAGADLDAIEIGALLHDIGKIGVPERILHKPAALDDDEWEIVKRHPVVSDYILAEVDLPQIVRQIARSSHERIDGKGYPDGLSGTEIALPARIVLVADAFDAITSERPYRSARSIQDAFEELRANAGTQFCPTVLAALDRVLEEEPDVLAGDLRPLAAEVA